ncbi:MAG: hypothetical protein IPL78_20700 [Chloroflexi bacterium]|nr:hypothetical protein [Chloroflexota bacterium]
MEFYSRSSGGNIGYADRCAKESAQSKQMMIFILVMSLSGLADLVAEIMPQLELAARN